MSKDRYEPVPGEGHTLVEYPCGVLAGATLRLKRDLHHRDHRGEPTGRVHQAGCVWSVLPGLPLEPEVVWLRDPEGSEHTWDDDDLLEWFEVLA